MYLEICCPYLFGDAVALSSMLSWNTNVHSAFRFYSLAMAFSAGFIHCLLIPSA